MKRKLKIAGGIIGGIAAFFIIATVFAGTCLPPPPERVTPTPEPLPPPTEEEPPHKVIEDLAYITLFTVPYSDDADPEYEGIEISILWKDSESELIFFRNIPVLVSIELFTRELNVETFEYEPDRCVYKGETEIDSFSSEIRIPFEDIEADPKRDDQLGLAKVTVHTPQQGDFSATEDWVSLYESD